SNQSRSMDVCFVFLQAEDGIRDRNVTGVQTCALPISVENQLNAFQKNVNAELDDLLDTYEAFKKTIEGTFKDGIIEDYELKILRSEERRVGKECRSRR